MRLRVGTAVALIAIATCLALDLRVAARGDPDPVPADVMARARELIAAELRPGDLVVHSPLLSITELAPLGDLRASPALPGPELRASRRILVLDVRDQPMHGFGEPDALQDISERLVLAIHEPQGGARVVLFDLHDDLSRARMRIERPAGHVTSSCTAPRAEGGFSCPGEAEWLYLARRGLDISGRNQTCVWAHPTTGGVIVIEIPAQPAPAAGRRLRLSVSAGMTDDAVRNTPDGAVVETAILQGGVEKDRVVAPNRIGWTSKELVIEPDRPVELRITTPRDGRRHHCVNARVEEIE